ncbi:MAG: zf-HC2 domain-containing protein, partial [Gemmatimonadetes bacterium]|nr:zf-HC2 domain-containing protein [Gemmatimonadota bacterium]
MSDRWRELLSDYLDGELSDAVRQELEIHLLDCAECRATLDGLAAVVEAAGRLEPRQPPRDVWAGIAARIAAERTHEGNVSGAPSDFVSRLRHRLSRPQIAAAWMPVTAFVSFAIRYRPSIPQVAAAAVVVALLSAGTTWFLLTGGTQRAPLAAGTG